MSSIWTSFFSPPFLREYSTIDSFAFLPTVTLIGIPIRSLSLNLTPALSFLSSSKTSRPMELSSL